LIYLLYYISCRKFNINLNKKNYFKIQIISIAIYKLLIKYLSVILIKSNSIYLVLNNNKNFINLLLILKNLFSFNFSQLLDIIIVDRLEIKSYEIKRFNYLYVLLSIFSNFRIFICGFLFLFEILPSITSLFKSADWLEREIWDMYGIFFSGHINLRRILTDYGFIGFPLRKDFPLSGYYDLRYDEISKSIVLEPLELMQEFRFFKLEIPWRK
jgi:NADH:ubiquinone oxidoreductase subunit C